MLLLAGYSPAATVLAGTGSTILSVGTLAQKPLAIRCSFERDDTGAVVPRLVDQWTPVMADGSAFPSLPTTLQWAQVENGRIHMLVSGANGLSYYASDDEMRTWLH